MAAKTDSLATALRWTLVENIDDLKVHEWNAQPTVSWMDRVRGERVGRIFYGGNAQANAEGNAERFAAELRRS